MSRSFQELEMEQSVSTNRSAYCPHCRAVTNLRAFITVRFVSGTDGDKRIATSQEYHCEACNLFVRSDEELVTSHGL